ncbi:hypothetical protein DM02DRAFT_401219 [Periconia macrospinosa]|uniref:Uncharacterized protein n=1 Tax=Periconia macrospinosa TaxID=97972 RepID=A0A2V1DQB7_9PLEO|nr:hypothetical protein DM02DRAFT_401219 [Periconia macrospinosa]
MYVQYSRHPNTEFDHANTFPISFHHTYSVIISCLSFSHYLNPSPFPLIPQSKTRDPNATGDSQYTNAHEPPEPVYAAIGISIYMFTAAELSVDENNSVDYGHGDNTSMVWKMQMKWLVLYRVPNRVRWWQVLLLGTAPD